MTFTYFPHTPEDIRQMLERSGVSSYEELYADVPAELRFKGEYNLPDAMSEMDVRRYFEDIDRQNSRLTVFCGAGAYDHYTPSAVRYILSRSEFLTAYTPYQAEISQGTLRYIFEFQSMICSLTGLDCSNASMYDGPTSAAESLLMCAAASRKRKKVLASSTLLPQVLDVVRTYAGYHGLELETIGQSGGETSLESAVALLSAGDVAGVLVPGINRYGIIENLTGFADAVHSAGALLAEYCDPSSLAVVKTPGEWGADIACGDAQTLGIPLSFGGPYVGFLACRSDLMRKLPGRIAGATVDLDGRRSFVLTLQAREQHIRRDKATSNICSNQSLMALFVTVYLSLMGNEGLRKVNDLSYGGAHCLHRRLLETGKFTDVFDKPFLKEFVLDTTLDREVLQKALLDAGFFAALGTEEGHVSFCVTERRTVQEIDALVDVISRL